jgi:site-specific recombinase XerD
MTPALALAAQHSSALAAVSLDTMDNLNAAVTDATRKRYRPVLRDFAVWCSARGVVSIPAIPATVADYISDMAARGSKAATIQLALAAIGAAHQAAGAEVQPTKSLLVKTTLRGIRRRIGAKQDQAKAVEKEDLIMMLAKLPDNLRGIRDRALLLIGFGAALRRSELVALDAADVECREGWLVIHIRKSKTDQEGSGHDIVIPSGRTEATCAARALKTWLERANIASGAIFRSIDRHDHIKERMTAQSVRLVVRNRAAAAGFDPEPYSGHSLRAGFATSAALAGASESEIMQTTRHSSSATLKRYIRIADLRKHNAAARIAL